MSLREAALLALYALELEDMACRHEKEQTPEQIAKAITALHAALAKPAEFVCSTGLCRYRKPLTDEELKPIADQYEIVFGGWVTDFARSIEEAVWKKNF